MRQCWATIPYMGKVTVNGLMRSLLAATFANSLDPDQAGQNVAPDLDTNCLSL